MKNLFKNKTFLKIGIVGFIAIVVGFTASTTLLPKHAAGSAKNCPDTCVLLTADGMNPNVLAIKKGQYVQFVTADGQEHEIGIGSGEGDEDHHHEHEHLSDYTSGDFGPGEAWRVQFKEVGSYQFHDHHHPKLNILVVVYDPAKPAKIN